MKMFYFVFLFLLNITVIKTLTVGELLRHLSRKSFKDSQINNIPLEPEHVPGPESILPGHTLLRPSMTMLKSSAKYPNKEFEVGREVYGNKKNIGIRYGKENSMLAYSNFRKSRNTENNHQRDRGHPDINSKIIYIMPINDLSWHSLNSHKNLPRKGMNKEGLPKSITNIPNNRVMPPITESAEMWNAKDSTLGKYEYPKSQSRFDKSYEQRKPKNLLVILSKKYISSSNEKGFGEVQDFRKHNKHKKDKLRRKDIYPRDRVYGRAGTDDESSDGSSGSEEHNPGNPYTIHKDKYYQNWLWDFEMTGDHMNVNPHAPILVDTGPVTNVFFGRKWWYFNQDDYLPLR